MIFMLRRHSLLGKKNGKKVELEKTQNLLKSQLEMTLRNCNRRSETDLVDLMQLKSDFVLRLSEEQRSLISHFKKIVHDYVQVNNDYVKMKINEEKAKAKKPKVNEEKMA